MSCTVLCLELFSEDNVVPRECLRGLLGIVQCNIVSTTSNSKVGGEGHKEG